MFVNLQLLRPWNGHQAGRVFQDFPASSAELLVRRDVAVVIPASGGVEPKGAKPKPKGPKTLKTEN